MPKGKLTTQDCKVRKREFNLDTYKNKKFYIGNWTIKKSRPGWFIGGV
jgi:hypothetical protein